MASATNNNGDQVQPPESSRFSEPEVNVVPQVPDQPGKTKPTPIATDSMITVTAMLTASSISTYIQCELPMVDKRLTPLDRDDLNDFVKSHLSGRDSRSMQDEMNFLSTHPMSVAKKLFLEKMEALYDGPVPGVEYAPFSYHIGRMKMAKDFDQLVLERKEQKAAKVKAKEEAARKRELERKLGGIGMVDGKPVFGPVTPWDGKEERDDVPYAQPLYVSRAAIEGMMGSRKQFA
ncbi:hypothetical protein PRZ48_015181 [Zasmidium cellare]|uniref:Uncharacterized protein n=1 Tax=Zasmidium cellare TaxID=395010 RepID=A0ABR0DXU2_ZASCE|nr:hypothetical protein PRZ48_015181 [Zasmidium cellare]